MNFFLALLVLFSGLISLNSDAATKIGENYSLRKRTNLTIGPGALELLSDNGRCYLKVVGMHKYEPGFFLDLPSPCYFIDVVDKSFLRQEAIYIGKGQIVLAVVGGVDDSSKCGKDVQGVNLSQVSVKKISHFVTQEANEADAICLRDGLFVNSVWYKRVFWGGK